MDNETTITFFLSRELKRAVQHLAIDQGISMSELLRAMLKDEIEKFHDAYNDRGQPTWLEGDS